MIAKVVQRPTIYVYGLDAEEGLSIDGQNFENIAAYGDETCAVCGEPFARWDDNWTTATKPYTDHHKDCVDIVVVGKESQKMTIYVVTGITENHVVFQKVYRNKAEAVIITEAFKTTFKGTISTAETRSYDLATGDIEQHIYA